jgi:hypothetical protein
MVTRVKRLYLRMAVRTQGNTILERIGSTISLLLDVVANQPRVLTLVA